ncbi:TetR/AcrR family transcriptional regulator [Antrihabitans sp. YC2-6]|uniref:TetR/AcrR family transcriptional regulator n=1 Tax=Antrihabitans sp. YC2-6 TaxID=2799498 RepID=UPI0018F4948C|nr:TetR/AcrR family transcriptional regulator [Antrihabitans sp. YC2-6]MBJ8344263.1 TetR family transcriptional regulator [Antrihabitans sp. YC2-6]
METRTRTQAERRAATVTALLDATIETLVDVGYTALTTRGVADRAGVSQGAQQHYFPTKTTLVEAAMHRLVEQLAAQAAARPIDADTERERAEILLERLWELHNLPICPAVFELFNVARTDPDMAANIGAILGFGRTAMQSIAVSMVPTYAARPDFGDLIDLAVSTIRGAVIMSPIPGMGDVYANWPVIRRHLMAVLDASLADTAKPGS